MAEERCYTWVVPVASVVLAVAIVGLSTLLAVMLRG
jgi:hypothetical protein